MRRLLAVVALTATALFAAASGAPGQTLTPVSIARVPAEIVDLLKTYAEAWRTHDSTRLASTLAPSISHHELAALANAKDVPFSRYEVTVLTQYSGDLASQRVRALYKGQAVHAFHVQEKTQVGDETGTFVEDGAFTFVQAASGGAFGGWRIASKSDLDVLGFFSPHHLWDEGVVTDLKGEHFAILTHPQAVPVMQPVLGVLERAYERVQKFWPHTEGRRFVLIVPSTTAELGRVMHETVDLGKFVAFVANGNDRSTGWAPTGPRMFIHLDHLKGYAPAQQLEILSHELVHAVTRDEAGPNTPAWVEEGLANFGGGNGGRPLIATHPAPDVFPSDDLFVIGSVQSIQRIYDQGQLAIQVLDEHSGRDGLVRFYDDLGADRVVPGTGEYWVKQSVEHADSWPYADWLKAWQDKMNRS